MSENLHPVRKVIVGDVSADIDEELAPIVEAIWRLGLTTWTSCQNAGESNADWPQQLPHMGPIIAAQLGWAYIDFPIHDGLAFLTALAQAGPRDAFYLRMAHWAAPDSWDVSARPMDAATFDHTRESQFGLQLLMVRFPSYDSDEILRRLTAYEAGQLTAPGPVDRSSMTPSALPPSRPGDLSALSIEQSLIGSGEGRHPHHASRPTPGLAPGSWTRGLCGRGQRSRRCRGAFVGDR